MCIENCDKTFETENSRNKIERKCCALYNISADDIASLAGSYRDMEKIQNMFSSALREFKLNVNANKIKLVRIIRINQQATFNISKIEISNTEEVISSAI